MISILSQFSTTKDTKVENGKDTGSPRPRKGNRMLVERPVAFVYERSIERPYFVYFVSFVVRIKRRPGHRLQEA
jgi:hypothetical protein